MEAERAVLATIMLDSTECDYAFERLKPEYFKKGNYSGVFEEMVKLRTRGIQIDIVTMSENTTHQELLMDLASESFTTSMIRTHVDMVLDNYYKREAYRKLAYTAEGLTNNNFTIPELRKKVESIAAMLSERTVEKGLRSLVEIRKDTENNFEIIRNGGSPGVKSGFEELDKNGFYFRPKTLNILAARPMMGKSALALDIAKKSGVNTAFFSIEMGAEEQYERLLSPLAKLTNDEFRMCDVMQAKENSIKECMSEVDKQKIWISDDRRVTIPYIVSQCKRLSAENPLGLLIVDYMGLITPIGKNKSRREEVTEISHMLKQASSDLNLPILALSQLNRECETRSDKRPILADLRESGDIEQDAHMVWFLYRDEVYNKSAEKGKAEILVRKNRAGKIGRVYLTFEGKFTTFKNYVPNDNFSARPSNDWYNKD